MFIGKVIFYSFFIYFVLSSSVYSQDIEEFSDRDIQKSAIDKYVYDYWSPTKEYRWWFKRKDSVPYFVDERKYKGVVNYGVNIESTDRRNVNFIESLILFRQKVIFDDFKFNSADSTISANGRILGRRTGDNWRGVDNKIDIYLGKRKDTIRNIHFQFLWPNQNVITKFKGNIVKDSVVLDKFPAFCLSEYTKFKSTKGNERKFSITGKINENTILTFGLSSVFTEIYDIGKLIFSEYELPSKITRKELDINEPLVIVQNNKVINSESAVNVEPDEYFEGIISAERSLLLKKYSKALEKYNILDQKYDLFARDKHNALRCAVLTKNIDNAISWSNKLIELGIPTHYFDHQIFKEIARNKTWQIYLRDIKSKEQTNKINLDNKMISVLNQLIEKDQEVYKLNARKAIEWSEVLKRNDSVTKEFIKVIREFGFPTESKVGVDMKGKYTISTPRYYVLIRHAYQNRSKYLNELNKIISENSKNQNYDHQRDKLEIFLENRTCYNIYKGSLYKENSCVITDMMMRSKIEFSFSDPNNFIISGLNFIVTPFEKSREKEDAHHFNNNFTFISKLTDDWFWYEK